MREDAAWWQKLFFSYARPLLDSSMKQTIKYEQLGEVPDRLSNARAVKDLTDNIRYYTDRNPNDNHAMMKGILSANRWRFGKFLVVRLLLCLKEFYIPFLMVNFLTWLQETEEMDHWNTAKAFMQAMLIPLSQMAFHTIWEGFAFQMIETGHMCHTSLKNMLFAKRMRMSSATNKDFSEGETSSLIMGDTNRIWDFVWQMPEIIEAPFILIGSCYLTFQYIGWYGLIVVGLTLLRFVISFVREKSMKDIGKGFREKNEKRMLHINESF